MAASDNTAITVPAAPPFPAGTTVKSFPIGNGPDHRLKFRTEYWHDDVCLYAWEYDQLTYGDPG